MGICSYLGTAGNMKWWVLLLWSWKEASFLSISFFLSFFFCVDSILGGKTLIRTNLARARESAHETWLEKRNGCALTSPPFSRSTFTLDTQHVKMLPGCHYALTLLPNSSPLKKEIQSERSRPHFTEMHCRHGWICWLCQTVQSVRHNIYMAICISHNFFLVNFSTSTHAFSLLG